MEYRQPFEGKYGISQYFGPTEWSKNHTGIDYLCPSGTPVLAAEAGTVIFAGWKDGGYGYCVFIRHSDNMVTIYEHLLKDIPVSLGQKVARSQVIGWSGSTGNSTGPHLHFEMRDVNGNPVDPMNYLHSSIEKPIEPEKPKQEHPKVGGICKVVCDSAWVRDWKNVERSYLLYRGDIVYVFDDVKIHDGLPYRFIGANRCMAEYDAFDTQILGNSE